MATYTVNIVGKTMDLSPLSGKVVSGDNNADTIQLVMDKMYGDVDMSQYGFMIKGLNSLGKVVTQPLTKDTSVADKLSFKWVVTKDFTDVSGLMQVWLWASATNFSWNTDDTAVFKVAKGLNVAEYSDIGEQYLTKFQELSADTENFANNAKTSETNAAASAATAVSAKDTAVASATSASASASSATSSKNAAATSATNAATSATAAAESAAQAQAIKDSTELSYNIDAVNNRVGFKRANEAAFSYTPNLKGPQGATGATGATGPQGIQGVQGNAGTITMGSVTTLSADRDAVAVNVGTNTNAIINLGIPRGPQGPKGDKGDGLQVSGYFSTLAALQSAFPNGNGNAVYWVGTYLYAWSGTAWANQGQLKGNDGKSAYQTWLDAGNTGTELEFLASLKGATGTTGAAGQAATIAIGTVTEGSSMQAVNSGNPNAAVFDFTLKAGKDGKSAYQAAIDGGMSSSITESVFNGNIAAVGNKIDKVTSATGNIPKFKSDGSLESSGIAATAVQTKTGAASDNTVAFAEAETLESIVTGDKLSIAFGKIAKMSTLLLPLIGKKMGAYGDSITYGQTSSSTQSTRNWVKVFGEETGAIVANNGIVGTCMAVGAGYGITDAINANAFCNRIDVADLSTYDYLYIAYGTNDYGYVIDIGDDDVAHPKTTFKGALHYSLTKIATTYPNLKVVLLTPMYATTSQVKNAKGYTMSDYVEAIKDVASQYGIPVIDMHRGMCINSSNRTSMYWDGIMHPTDSTYEAMGKYIARVIPQATIHKDSIKDLMPVTGGYNLIKYGDFNPTGNYNYFPDKTKEKGVTFRLLPNVINASNAFLKVVPNETLYLTYWCYADAGSSDQIYEVDLYNGSAVLVTSKQATKTGEHFVVIKLEIPATASTSTLYQLRFTTYSSNAAWVTYSSLMLTRSNIPMKWAPAPVENTEMWFYPLTLASPTVAGATAPTYRKNGNGNVQLRGHAVVTTGYEIGTLPENCRPQYGITTTIISTDGTLTFAVISTGGIVSAGALNKTYDLSSIPPFFAGIVDVR